MLRFRRKKEKQGDDDDEEEDALRLCRSACALMEECFSLDGAFFACMHQCLRTFPESYGLTKIEEALLSMFSFFFFLTSRLSVDLKNIDIQYQDAIFPDTITVNVKLPLRTHHRISLVEQAQ